MGMMSRCMPAACLLAELVEPLALFDDAVHQAGVWAEEKATIPDRVSMIGDSSSMFSSGGFAYHV